jgi:SAM-dependent methyltransferase
MQNVSGAKNSFEILAQEAWNHGIQGWDWRFLDGRMEAEPLPWDYAVLARQRMPGTGCMLDIGTGGGELLSTLGPFPACTIATEAYPPSVGLAARTLKPYNIQVLWTDDGVSIPLPLAPGALDFVINRHAGYDPVEVFRVLRPGGRFLTQQVGGKDQLRLNELFQDEVHFIYSDWTLERARNDLEEAGFTILEANEAFPKTRFLDIGAVVYYLRIIDWQVPGFDVEKDRETLSQIHAAIQKEGWLTTWQHRFLVEAIKPA